MANHMPQPAPGVQAARGILGTRTGSRNFSLARREELYAYIFLIPWIVGFVVFIAGPMIAAFWLSLYDTNFMNTWAYVGLRWWKALFTDALVHKALLNTLYYVAVSVPGSTIVAMVIAILLNQGMKAQSVWRTIYYLPSLVSGVAVAVLWQWLYHPDYGLINDLLGQIGIQGPRWIYKSEWAMPALLIMSLWAAGATMLIYLAGLRSIPTALYEAAEIDGAGTMGKFWHITIPMLTPTIFFNVLMNLIGSWQVFTQAFVMTNGGPNNATLTAVLHIYRTGFTNGYFGYASAQAGLLFLIILVFILFAIRSAEFWVQYERV
jgi:multiple sugar transport system permease protein